MKRFTILIPIILVLLSACNSIPKPKPISGSLITAPTDVSHNKTTQINKLDNIVFKKKLFYSGGIPENQKVKYWFYAQNADKIFILGQQYLLGKAYSDLSNIGVPCHKICVFKVDESIFPVELMFFKQRRKKRS